MGTTLRLAQSGGKPERGVEARLKRILKPRIPRGLRFYQFAGRSIYFAAEAGA
jgi:hypothetical protein